MILWFYDSGFSTLKNYVHMCASPSDACLWRAVGRCPREYLQEGHLPPAPLAIQQELFCRDPCPALTWTMCGPPWDWGQQWRGEDWVRKARDLWQQLSAISLHLFANFLGSHWRTEQQALTPWAVSLQFKCCRMPLFLHTHPSRPWLHLPFGQNKAPHVPLPGELWGSTPPRTDTQALGQEEGGCWCPDPSSGRHAARPDLCRHQETLPLSPLHEEGKHGGLSSTLSRHRTSSIWVWEQPLAQLGETGRMLQVHNVNIGNSSIIFNNILFSLAKTQHFS